MTERLNVDNDLSFVSEEVSSILERLDWDALSARRLVCADDDVAAFDAKDSVWTPIRQRMDLLANERLEM